MSGNPTSTRGPGASEGRVTGPQAGQEETGIDSTHGGKYAHTPPCWYAPQRRLLRGSLSRPLTAHAAANSLESIVRQRAHVMTRGAPSGPGAGPCGALAPESPAAARPAGVTIDTGAGGNLAGTPPAPPPLPPGTDMTLPGVNIPGPMPPTMKPVPGPYIAWKPIGPNEAVIIGPAIGGGFIC